MPTPAPPLAVRELYPSPRWSDPLTWAVPIAKFTPMIIASTALTLLVGRQEEHSV